MGATVELAATAARAHNNFDILQLQRSIGNRAVSWVLRGRSEEPAQHQGHPDSVGEPQRPAGWQSFVEKAPATGAATHINPSHADLPIQRVFGRNMNKRIRANKYENLEMVVGKAERGEATREELNKALQKVKRYKKSAGKMKGDGVAERLKTLSYIGDELTFGLDRLDAGASKTAAKDTYLQEGRSGGLKVLTESSKGLFKERRGGEDELPPPHGLDQAEAAAVTAYTKNDFQYINPAAAFDKGWMGAQSDANNLKGTRKEQFDEGGLHAGMMMEAMAKLPRYTGDGFRGERMTPTRFAEQYVEEGDRVTAKQTTSVKTGFWSVSTERTTGESFAQSSQVRDETVSVVYIIDLGNARDVQALSPSEEAEVLCPPGSKVTVSRVIKLRAGTIGVPPATAWYEVYLSQT